MPVSVFFRSLEPKVTAQVVVVTLALAELSTDAQPLVGRQRGLLQGIISIQDSKLRARGRGRWDHGICCIIPFNVWPFCLKDLCAFQKPCRHTFEGQTNASCGVEPTTNYFHSRLRGLYGLNFCMHNKFNSHSKLAGNAFEKCLRHEFCSHSSLDIETIAYVLRALNSSKLWRRAQWKCKFWKSTQTCLMHKHVDPSEQMHSFVSSTQCPIKLHSL